jgi:hypothetical protein
MKSDTIAEIGIDSQERLYIVPLKEQFPLIWRSATEVHWEPNSYYLYSPMPREWNYIDWYLHILRVIKDECACQLLLAADTNWVNIPDELKHEIMNNDFK